MACQDNSKHANCQNVTAHEHYTDFLKHIWGLVCQKQVSTAGASNYISQYLWDVITCPCPWYLLLPRKSSYIVSQQSNQLNSTTHCCCCNPKQWRHNERDGVSNHKPHHCLLKRLFRRRSKKTSKLCVTGLCEGNSPVTGEFPAQRASNAENVSIWWRHHAVVSFHQMIKIKRYFKWKGMEAYMLNFPTTTISSVICCLSDQSVFLGHFY